MKAYIIEHDTGKQVGSFEYEDGLEPSEYGSFWTLIKGIDSDDTFTVTVTARNETVTWTGVLISSLPGM